MGGYKAPISSGIEKNRKKEIVKWKLTGNSVSIVSSISSSDYEGSCFIVVAAIVVVIIIVVVVVSITTTIGMITIQLGTVSLDMAFLTTRETSVRVNSLLLLWLLLLLRFVL